MFFELDGKKVLVVGGGRIGSERALTLLRFGCEVKVVSKQMSKNLIEAAKKNKKLTLVCRAFCSSDIEEEAISLCVSAVSSFEVNYRVSKLCAAKKIPVNVASQKELSTFYFPSIVMREDIVCGISSSGKSPLISKFLRGRIEEAIPPFLPKVNSRMEKIRCRAKEKFFSQEARERILKNIFDLLIKSKNSVSESEIEKIISEITKDTSSCSE